MLLIRLRVRPCRARLRRSSSGRVTLMTLPASSCFTWMLRWWAISSLPLGPSTSTLPSRTCTLTPAGMTTGCFPIRDMTPSPSLPNGAEQFAAEALGAGLAVAHDPLAGAEDGDPQPVEHRPQVLDAAVQAPPRLAGPVDRADHLFALGAVFEVDPQDRVRLGRVGRRLENGLALLVGRHLADLEVQDEAFVLEHLGDLLFQPGGPHLHRRPFDAVGVADTSQHVGDRVSHHGV